MVDGGLHEPVVGVEIERRKRQLGDQALLGLVQPGGLLGGRGRGEGAAAERIVSGVGPVRIVGGRVGGEIAEQVGCVGHVGNRGDEADVVVALAQGGEVDLGIARDEADVDVQFLFPSGLDGFDDGRADPGGDFEPREIPAFGKPRLGEQAARGGGIFRRPVGELGRGIAGGAERRREEAVGRLLTAAQDEGDQLGTMESEGQGLAGTVMVTSSWPAR